MPFEAVLIVLILFVIAPAVVFRGVRSLRESGKTAPRAKENSGASMRKSQLEALIQSAVIDATAPLEARIDELEREVLLGSGRIAPDALAEAFDAPDAVESRAEPARQRA